MLDCLLFKKMNQFEIRNCLAFFHTSHYLKGEVVFRQGEHIDFIMILCEGSIEINNYDVDGNKKIVTLLEPGDIFAESVAFAQEKESPFNIVATTKVEVMTISAVQFYAIENMQLIKNMMEILANKNTFLTHKIECLSKSTIQERMYEVLKFFYYKQKKQCLNLPYNKTQLAEYMCVSRSSLVREIAKMEHMGLFKNIKNRYELNLKHFH